MRKVFGVTGVSRSFERDAKAFASFLRAMHEGMHSLALNTEKLTAELYSVIKQIYDDIGEELELKNPYNSAIMFSKTDLQPNSFRRGLIESICNGADVYLSEGELIKQTFVSAPGIVPPPNISDNRFFEDRKHEN